MTKTQAIADADKVCSAAIGYAKGKRNEAITAALNTLDAAVAAVTAVTVAILDKKKAVEAANKALEDAYAAAIQTRYAAYKAANKED